MNMKEIKKIAVEMGIKPGRMRKADLIRSIQAAEGNPVCFQTGSSADCREDDCLWRADCN